MVSSLSSASCKYEGIFWRSSAVFIDRQRDLRGCSWWKDRGRRRERGTLMCKCKHGWHGDGAFFVRTTQPWNLEPCIQGCELCVHWDNCVQKCKQFCEELNRNTQPTGETNMSSSSGKTDKKQNKGTVQRHSLLRSRTCWRPQFRFQHGPFTKRFRPVITRVPAVVLSISRYSRLAVARAWLFALNQLTSEGTGTYSHFGPRHLRMSWLTCCCCTAVITCGIGLFHMARASSRLTSVQINTTKQFWLWCLAACLPPPPGAHIRLKMRKCVYTLRRLQGSVTDCKRNLQQDKGYCTKKKCRRTSYKSTRTLKSGCTPVRRTWEDHLSSLFHSEEFDEQASITGLSVLGCCSVHELRGTFWLSDMMFSRLSDALGLSDNENLFTVLISIPPHQIFTSLPVLVMNSQLLFADSLTSTLLDWLGQSTTPLLRFQKITGLWVLTFQHVDLAQLPNRGPSHRSLRAYLATLSLDTVEDVMVGEVDELEEDVGWSISCLEGVMVVEEGKLEEELVDKPRTIIAICFTCNRRRKSACWRNSWQVFPHIFRSNFGEDITDLCLTVLMCNDFLLCWLVETCLILQEGLLELLLVVGTLTPYRGGCSQNLISSKKFYLFICGFWNCHQFGRYHLLRVKLYVVEFWRVYFVHLLKVCYHKSSFPNFSLRVPDVFGECFG